MEEFGGTLAELKIEICMIIMIIEGVVRYQDKWRRRPGGGRPREEDLEEEDPEERDPEEINTEVKEPDDSSKEESSTGSNEYP